MGFLGWIKNGTKHTTGLQMNRQELITDFQHFLDAHKEEVKAHLSEPQPEWFEDDGWETKEKTE